jgi:hypothetical protein
MNPVIKFAVTPLIAVAIMTCVPLAQAQQQQHHFLAVNAKVAPWAVPPAGPVAMQKGFRDGVEAARVDSTVARLHPEMNRKVDAKASFQYVHPPVKKDQSLYQAGFEAGYQAALAHEVPA